MLEWEDQVVEAIALSDEDRAVLELECPTIAGHTCKVVRLAGPGVEVDALRARVEERIGRVAILRARLGGAPDAPAWVEDPSFRLEDHVVDSGESAIVEADLPGVVAGLFEARLDRDHPLWRIDLVSLSDGGSALVWRIHHALADGSTAMHMAEELLWDHEATPVSAAPAVPGPHGGHLEDDVRRRGHLAAFLAREFGESPHRSPFDGEVGTRRSIAFETLPFRPLHDAAKRGGGTVNDAVLAVVAGGLRRWLAEHDDDLGALRIRVPVSLHHEADEAANHDSFFTVPVPIGEDDVQRRLGAIADAAGERKRAHDAEVLDSALRGLSEHSPRLATLAERLQASPRSFAVCVSNIRGPSRGVTVHAAEVTSMHTLAEVGRRHGLRVAVVSAAGQLGFGFCADPGIVPDLTAMADGTAEAGQRLIAGP